MQCMRFKTHLREHPSQNFNESSSILKNPKNFKKTPKPRFQNMKCMNKKGLEAYQVKKNLKKLEESLRNKFGVRWECFGRETEKYRERDRREMNFGSHRGLI